MIHILKYFKKKVQPHPETARLLMLLRNQIVESYGEHFTGMCYEITDMWAHNIMPYEEREILRDYLELNRPALSIGAYWFPAGEKQPRLDWIDKQLLKLK